MKIRIPGLTTALALCGTAVFAGTIPKPGITPVQAELMTDVQAHLTKVGSTVFARVTIEWRGTDCLLRSGAILEAHVISVVPHTKTAKGSELGLAFTKAQCGEPKMSDFELLLAAVAAPAQNVDLGILSDPVPMIVAGVGTDQTSDPYALGLDRVFDVVVSAFMNHQARAAAVDHVRGVADHACHLMQ